MLKIKIPEQEVYDDEKNEFFTIREQSLTLEHSLVSIAKWESKWVKPFIDDKHDKTYEEMVDYIRCMTLTQGVDPAVYNYIPIDEYNRITAYIEAPMTATKISRNNESRAGIGRHEIITAEIIYYWMITLGIPFECQKWHINRLITLIQVCNIKNAPSKKMSKKGVYSQNAALNAARRKAMHSKG